MIFGKCKNCERLKQVIDYQDAIIKALEAGVGTKLIFKGPKATDVYKIESLGEDGTITLVPAVGLKIVENPKPEEEK